MDRSKERGAHLLQLTTDKERPNTIKFYERLGFKASHIGMKLHLNQK
ncbi:MAG: ribosomal protein S18 acetylase RimI-like enzyme [Granulosicoccus sp.]